MYYNKFVNVINILKLNIVIYIGLDLMYYIYIYSINKLFDYLKKIKI